ncbi:MAG: hypothetical protein U0935_23745 [Pirellulales bacterium]
MSSQDAQPIASRSPFARFGTWLICLAGLWLGTVTATAGELSVDLIMDQDPLLVLAGWHYRYPTDVKPLWLQALARPDAETRRLAADTFTLAVSRKLPDLGDAVGPLLAVAQRDTDPVVRRAAARAVVALDGQQTAADLRQLAVRDGLLMAQIVEPALARWNDPAMREVWRGRLAQPTGERGYLALAIQGLGQVRDEESVEALLQLVRGGTVPVEVRTAAAQAAGQIRDQGLQDVAEQLRGQRERLEFLGRLLAVHLLERHSDARSQEILRALARDTEPAVAAAAIHRLWKIDRALALPLAPDALVHADARLRRLGAEILCEQGDVAAVERLGPALNDRNPGVRRLIAARFVELAKENEVLQQAVLAQATAVLAGDQWRGLEQAALVLGTLDHKPASERLVALLPFERGEVRVSVAWALRRLKVPETYERILQHATRVDESIAKEPYGSFTGRQQSQMFQLFGEVRYRPAEMLLRKYVPKSMLDVESRAAACWALGYLYLDNPNNDLVEQFVARLSDTQTPMPELSYVRQMTAVGLGRMRAEQTLPVLRKFAELDGRNSKPGRACGWSIERLTGEKMPPALEREVGVAGWFLEPLAVPPANAPAPAEGSSE